MAFVTYLVAPCAGGSAINVDFDGASLPEVGGNYYLTFTGGTAQGCYEIVDSAEPAVGVDTVSTMSINYGDCLTCLSVPTPTPTPTMTKTPTQTPTNTPTQSKTPTQTPTNTTTPSQTPTQTPTNTPTNTSTNTPTPSQTPTNTMTKTPTQTPTNTTTPSQTPTNTPTQSETPTQTPTNTTTPSQTPTNTTTPTNTPTPSPTPPGFWVITDCNGGSYIVEISGVSPTLGKMYLFTFSGLNPSYGCYFVTNTSYGPIVNTAVFNDGPYDDCVECGPNYTGVTVNQFYEYTPEMEGSFSGGTLPAGTTIPHPSYATNNGIAIQLNAVTLGGFNGLNN